MAESGLSGTAYVTADTQVVATGKPVRLFALHILSAGTGAVVSTKSGGSGGTVYTTSTGTASTGTVVNFGQQGIVLPSGLYIDVDGNTTSVLATYRVEAA